MALAVRFILTIMLVVGGLSPSEPVSASVLPPHSDSMSAHHHVAASGNDRTSRDKAAHCLTLASVCCAVVQPTGISPVSRFLDSTQSASPWIPRTRTKAGCLLSAS